MSDLMFVILCPTLMFTASFAFVNLMWYLDDKRIDREVKERYGDRK